MAETNALGGVTALLGCEDETRRASVQMIRFRNSTGERTDDAGQFIDLALGAAECAEL
jgi:hypothetical protein